ncbi:hypothetical protein [Methylobacterium mesophilicum]
MSGSRCDFAYDEAIGSDTLLVSFTSLGNVIGSPPKAGEFEWRHFLSGYRCHRAYLIDCFQHWYLGPVLGFSHSADATAERLLDLKRRLRARRLVFIGTSMGGFGALLIGAKARADHVIAVAPQTSVDRGFLTGIGDGRWEAKMTEIDNIAYADRDLRTVYDAQSGPERTQIFYDASCADDHQHVMNLAGLPGVAFEDVGFGGHACAYEMAKRGMLTRIVEAATASDTVKRRWPWQRNSA